MYKVDTLIVAVLLLWIAPRGIQAQEAGSRQAVDELVKAGFENVSCSEDDDERIFVLQNTAYKLNGVGIHKAIEIIQGSGMPETKKCRIIVLDNNVPQISLTYQRKTGEAAESIMPSDWTISYDLGDSWKLAKKGKKQNSSYFKVDVLVYPELSFKNLIINKIYQVLFNFSPAVEVSFWKGMKLSAQMVLPVHNDGYADYLGRVHPGFISLQQQVRLPYNTWMTFSAGAYNGEQYGFDVKAMHVFKDERFKVEARVGLTSSYYWDGFDLHYGTKKRVTGNIAGSFYWPRYNLETTMRVERYLLEETGVRVDMIRHFKYSSIGLYAQKANKGIRSNGGFRVQVALPPYRHKRTGYVPRVSMSKNMGVAYNAGNEQYYYKNYRTAPGENIMQNNSFNPFYIKSELLN